MTVIRDEKGRVVKGTGPLNPVGRPKTSWGVAELRRLAQTKTENALNTLVDLMNDPDVAAGTRAYCANSILERAHGKAVQPVLTKEMDAQAEKDAVNEREIARSIATNEELRERIAAAYMEAMGVSVPASAKVIDAKLEKKEKD